MRLTVEPEVCHDTILQNHLGEQEEEPQLRHWLDKRNLSLKEKYNLRKHLRLTLLSFLVDKWREEEMHSDFSRFSYSNLIIKVVVMTECAPGEVCERVLTTYTFSRERPRLRECIVLNWRGEEVQGSHTREFLRIYLVG